MAIFSSIIIVDKFRIDWLNDNLIINWSEISFYIHKSGETKKNFNEHYFNKIYLNNQYRIHIESNLMKFSDDDDSFPSLLKSHLTMVHISPVPTIQ